MNGIPEFAPSMKIESLSLTILGLETQLFHSLVREIACEQVSGKVGKLWIFLFGALKTAVFKHPGGLWNQNYFYNNTKVLFAFFTVLTFAQPVEKQWWVKFPPFSPNHCILHHVFAGGRKKLVSLKNVREDVVKIL